MEENNKVIEIPTSCDSALSVQVSSYMVEHQDGITEKGAEIVLVIDKSTGEDDDGVQYTFLNESQAIRLISVLAEKVNEIIKKRQDNAETD